MKIVLRQRLINQWAPGLVLYRGAPSRESCPYTVHDGGFAGEIASLQLTIRIDRDDGWFVGEISRNPVTSRTWRRYICQGPVVVRR